MLLKIVRFFIFVVVVLLLPNFGAAQISGMWHRSMYDFPFTDYSMTLKGPVKSWTMTDAKGKTRKMEFDSNGRLTSDTFNETQQTFVPPDFMVYKLKVNCEMVYEESVKKAGCTFNHRSQLLECKGERSLQKNTFDDQGRVLIHQTSSSWNEERAWNSGWPQRDPTYTVEVKQATLAFFRYNAIGDLTEIEYLSADPFENLRMVYEYDAEGHLLSTKRYNNYNIFIQDMPDHYLDTLLKMPLDTSFRIQKKFPNYWKQGTPTLTTWKWDDLGRKVESNSYGYRPDGMNAVLSFTAKWEYNAQGVLTKEIHYDVWNNRINAVLEFDARGNVVKQTTIGYDGRKDQVEVMRIEYFH